MPTKKELHRALAYTKLKPEEAFARLQKFKNAIRYKRMSLDKALASDYDICDNHKRVSSGKAQLIGELLNGVLPKAKAEENKTCDRATDESRDGSALDRSLAGDHQAQSETLL